MAFTQYPDIVTNSSSLQPILVGLNDNILHGLLGFLIIITLFIILVTRLSYNQKTSAAVASSSFLCTIAATFLWGIGIIDTIFIIVCIVITVGSVIWQYVDS